MEISLAIVGSAGRKDDSKRLSISHFESMYGIGKGLIDILKDVNYRPTVLVSGGAAWADHIAVRLFLDGVVNKLRLFLPCPLLPACFSLANDHCILKLFHLSAIQKCQEHQQHQFAEKPFAHFQGQESR